MFVKDHSSNEGTATPNQGSMIMVSGTPGAIQVGSICSSWCCILCPMLGGSKPLTPAGHI